MADKKEIVFFNEKVEKEVFSHTQIFQANFKHIFEALERFEINELSFVKKEEKGIYKIKFKQIRIYFVAIQQQVILLHIFIKKDNKTPKRHLELVRKRLKEVLSAF